MPILETIVAGFVGTIGMTFTMTLIHSFGWAQADMVRALGSLVTRRIDNALAPGILIHLASGIFFAFPYAVFLSLVGWGSGPAVVFTATVLGLGHGLVVSLLLVAVVSERHPVERFQDAGLEVAVSHLAGHVAYGFLVGVMVAAMDIHWSIGG
ncbi:MAG: hypothetical protein ACYTG6_05605 [Planctomycetota bacterium]|jgi:hypothetical protein